MMLTKTAAHIGFHFVMWGSLGRKRVVGLENLPDKGPYILVTNHIGIADSVLVLISLPRATPVRFLIGEKWRTLPFLGKLAVKLGGIYVDRSGLDRNALRLATEALADGNVLGMAPEGTRSPVNRMIKPRNGAAWLATQADVPLVPVGLCNTKGLFQNAGRLRPTPMEVIIGKPFTLPKLDVRRYRQRELSAYSDYIMLHIAQLIPASYHGYYAYTEHPGLETVLRGGDPWDDCLRTAGIV